MRPGRRAHRLVAALVAALVVLPPIGACAPPADGAAGPRRGPGPPASVRELGSHVVDEVPSGLPRLSDGDLRPPAGAKRMEDVAGYSDDPARERGVLRDLGYVHGWERFWGAPDGPVTSLFVDQFESRAGARAYAEDRAHNDAEHYRGSLTEEPPGLPGGCRLLIVTDPEPGTLHGPAASAWCVHGVYSVSATAVSDSVDAAEREVRAVVSAQLDRLPPG